MKTRVKYGRAQARIRNLLSQVDEERREGSYDLDLGPEMAEDSRKAVDGSVDDTPTVYLARRIAEEARHPENTVKDYIRRGKVGRFQRVVFGKQPYNVVARLPAEKFISERKTGKSVIEEGELTSQADLSRLLGVDDATMWSFAKRMKLPAAKIGKFVHYAPAEAAVIAQYFTSQRILSEEYASADEVAGRMGVTPRTVYNWLERDFEYDEQSGVYLPSYLPAFRVREGGHFRYFFSRARVEDDEHVGEWKKLFPREHKRKSLPRDRRDWHFVSDVAEALGEKKASVVTYVKNQALGEKHGNERIVSPDEEMRLWRHYACQRFADRYCLSIEEMADALGFNRNTFRSWVSREAERDERGPRSFAGIRFFRNEGNIYFPRRSPRDGYDATTKEGRAALRQRIINRGGGGETADLQGPAPDAGPSTTEPTQRRDEQRIAEMMMMSQHTPDQINSAIGTDKPENRVSAVTTLRSIFEGASFHTCQAEADDLIYALMKLNALNGRIPLPFPGEPRNRLLALLARVPAEDRATQATSIAGIINEAGTPQEVARQLTQLAGKYGEEPNRPTHWKKLL